MKVRRSLLFGTGHDGKQWIGTCPSLDVATVGDTRERAMEALEEAVNLWTKSCIQRGSIREALTELGFVPLQGAPLTNDFCQVDDEFYWRFPDYLPNAQGERGVRTLPDATPETGPNFEYRPHTGQVEVGSPRTTTADARWVAGVGTSGNSGRIGQRGPHTGGDEPSRRRRAPSTASATPHARG